MSEKMLKSRVKELANKLYLENIDAVLLLDPDNIRYYTDLRMNTAAHSMLLITANKEVTYIVPKLDYSRALRDCWINHIISFPEDNPNYFQPLLSILDSNILELGIEYSSITIEQWELLKTTYKGNIYNVENLVSELRMIKTEREIENLKKAGSIADIAMQEALNHAYSGNVREMDISAHAKFVMEREGAEGVSFEPFVMSGVDSALPRRFSTGKTLQKDELVVFDMGAKYKGYCSDITRTFTIGELNSKQNDIFEVAFQAQKIAIESLKPGMSSRDLDKISRDFIKENGYGENFPHLTGHGIGMSEHEIPIVDEDTDFILQPNMVITIEPGIYVEGVGAARIEDMVLITENGYELLTNTKRKLT